MSTSLYCIYRLIDPRDTRVHYVGLTTDMEARTVQHLRCNGSNPLKDAWIQEVISSGETISVEKIEAVSTLPLARRREAHWIHFYLDEQMPLTNIVIPELDPQNNHRDYDKYVYLSIALEKGGVAYRALVDIASSISSKQLPTVAAMCLVEYCEMKANGTLYDSIRDPLQRKVSMSPQEVQQRIHTYTARKSQIKQDIDYTLSLHLRVWVEEMVAALNPEMDVVSLDETTIVDLAMQLEQQLNEEYHQSLEGVL